MARDNSERIREITEILEAGASRVDVGGTVTQYDFAALREERKRLERSDDSHRSRRPTFLGINLGGDP